MPINAPPGMTLQWANVQEIPSVKYTCSFCGNQVASNRGLAAISSLSRALSAYACICHHCQEVTYIDWRGTQHPGVKRGRPVDHIDEEPVQMLYEEARAAAGAGAYTSCVLACRKLLMHIAVAKGAKEGETFLKYVEFLNAKHFIPPDAKEWVDQIRQTGNEANHAIVIMDEAAAEELLSFSEMLLKLVYEFPASVRRKSSSGAPAT